MTISPIFWGGTDSYLQKKAYEAALASKIKKRYTMIITSVDVRNPAPVDKWFIPLMIGFQPYFWWFIGFRWPIHSTSETGASDNFTTLAIQRLRLLKAVEFHLGSVGQPLRISIRTTIWKVAARLKGSIQHGEIPSINMYICMYIYIYIYVRTCVWR